MGLGPGVQVARLALVRNRNSSPPILGGVCSYRSRKVGGIGDGKIINSPLVSSVFSVKWEAVSSAVAGLWGMEGRRMLEMGK